MPDPIRTPQVGYRLELRYREALRALARQLHERDRRVHPSEANAVRWLVDHHLASSGQTLENTSGKITDCG